ncbi:MAG: hypothetical protein CMO38_06810 [Verrucomicrobiaceae bacterium]|nr:hypothetical protein [Verrucomicrobiaceae bacterium]|tara:strand:- start:135 stop:1037 length:903 start_codon:yes stop_codon:yes gene_type:complete
MKNKYETIVIDAANILHNDAGIVIKNENGERVLQIRPERLRDCILFCEDKGWKVIAFLKQGTYRMAMRLTKSNSVAMGDIDILDNLKDNDKLYLIPRDKEDIYWIDYAISENALIITQDKFRFEKKTYPDRDWEDINNRTLRDFEFVNSKFILPSLKNKELKTNQEEKQITLNQIFAAIQKLSSNVAELEKYVRKREFTNLKKSEFKPKSKQQQIKSNLEIVNTVVNSLLSSGDAVAASHIHAELARPILGLNGKQDTWKSGWNDELRQTLGYPKKEFKQWLISNSKKKIISEGNKLSYA